MRPFYFVVVFWGEKYRKFFETFCLPSLLAPGNVPPLASAAPGSKILIFTTEPDWEALNRRPLFALLRQHIQAEFHPLGFPGAGDLVQLHMSKGHRAGAELSFRDEAYCVYLAPDLILSDGTVAALLYRAGAGAGAVMAPAIRFEMGGVAKALEEQGFLRPDQVLAVPARQLADIATQHLHAEFKRFCWDRPYFVDRPIAICLEAPDDGLVVFTASWAIVMANFAQLGGLETGSLEHNTIDRQFMCENLYPHRGGKLELVTDSDELLYVSMTSEDDLPLPLTPDWLNTSMFGQLHRVENARKLIHSDYMDPFMRWLYETPALIHGSEIDARWHPIIARARQISETIRRPPSPVLNTLVVHGLRALERLRRKPRRELFDAAARRIAASQKVQAVFARWPLLKNAAKRFRNAVGSR